ncbi:MAG: glycosyltransferase [Alphaproteobacteria bacterium]|nr:glycosyltransferase [Alphaproteobacteria bacterium]
MTQLVEITIPVLDEEKTIDAQIRRVIETVGLQASRACSYHIVIADNGSTDTTPELASNLEKEFPEQVSYLRLNERGVGRALKASWNRSTADIVGYFDLDLATDLKHLPEAIDLILNHQADVVTGTRLAKGSRVVGRSLKRAITSRLFNGIVKTMFNNGFTDGMCGFKFLRREHVNRICESGAQSDGWIFATELLITAEHLGLKVVDVPVSWKDDPDTKVKIASLAVEYIVSLRALRKKLVNKGRTG